MAKENTKPTEMSQFEKALKFEIPQEKIETISDRSGGRPLSYVSWAYAWGMFKQIYPDAKYRIIKNENGLPYFADKDTGIMVYTEITANGETHEMWLFVMNSSNKAMRLEPYTYKKWKKYENRWEEFGVEAATMFDINKTLMRCLVKNMAMFGFGLNVYNGDDLPEFDLESDTDANKKKEPKVRRGNSQTPVATPAKSAPQVAQAAILVATAPVNFSNSLDVTPGDPYAGLKQILKNLQTIEQMKELYNQYKDQVESNPEVKNLFSLRKKQINVA